LMLLSRNVWLKQLRTTEGAHFWKPSLKWNAPVWI
jgi:hypothetical protein